MPAQYADIVHAVGSVRGTAGVPVVGGGQLGFSPTVIVNAPGSFTLTLAEAIDQDESCVFLQARGVSGVSVSLLYTRPTDSTIAIVTNVGGSPEGIDFDIQVIRTRIG